MKMVDENRQFVRTHCSRKFAL